VGSGDLLGNSLDQTWVRQVAVGRYEAGRCAQVDAGTGGGGGSASGGGGGSAAGGGGGSAAGGGGGSASGGGGGSAAGGGTATGGGNATAGTGCGCTSVDPAAILLAALLFSRRKLTSSTRGPRSNESRG
jgi:uncharacterized protein (TIGR03382 family)